MSKTLIVSILILFSAVSVFAGEFEDNFKKANQGDAAAQCDLGTMYGVGEKIPQDYKKAIYWYEKSANQGNKWAQYNLGNNFLFGWGTPINYKLAVYWYEKSANQGAKNAQYNLGHMYSKGKGVTQNYKLAYVWYSLAAAQGHKKAISSRDFNSKKLSLQQLATAQELAVKIQYRIDHPTNAQEQQPPVPNTERKMIGSGTGFIITKDGYILTCHHVIETANEIKISIEGIMYNARLVRDDPKNDLALLKINGSFSAIPFSSKRFAKMGQNVFTIGYPNPDLQGLNAKFTNGTINSLSGFQDDIRIYQISVPVQPGNSGGALVDENGNILGIIVARLSAKTIFKISGSLPQNVNYAIKSIYAKAMLDTLPEMFDKLIEPSKTKLDAIDRVKKSTVMVLNYK